MRNFFIFDGINSRDYGVYISGSGVFDAPARRGEVIQVPGRNGDLFLDEGSYNNVELKYPAFIVRNFKANIAGLRNVLISKSGYCRLQDSYHPEEYRMARYAGGLETTPLANLKAANFDLIFDCSPQRFLISGEDKVTFYSSGSIYNPTEQDAKPLIRVYGTGLIVIGTTSVTITQADTYTDLDCDMQEAYKGGTLKNQYVVLSGNDYPVLQPGPNTIAVGSGISRIEITPRWWRL